jgi:predicted nucleic acid-binding protein
MVIVDTTVWIDYLRGTENPEASWLVWQLQRQSLWLTDMILCEVLKGIREPRTLAQVRDDLLQFHVFHAGGAELAIAAAQNYQILRARGHTVRKTIDCLIATFCLEADHELLHRDRDFDVFEKELGLRVVHA